MTKRLFLALTLSTCLLNCKCYCQTVILDYYFNHENKNGANGQPQRFHYLWEDTTNTGFSTWGSVFKSKGARLSSLDTAPAKATLKGASVYIIVDPDSKKENPDPHYITETDAVQIAQWVKTGGVLILMANDSANVELPHFNTLANRFGLHFNNDIQNHVIDDTHFNDGAIMINHHPIFKTSKKVFLKDVCSLTLKGKAVPVLRSANGAVIAAVTQYGRGTVFAVGDPWLYNEYVNGRLPAGFDNNHAAADLATWALAMAKRSGQRIETY